MKVHLKIHPKDRDTREQAVQLAERAESAKRTLTGLYNAHPTWLAHAHDELDRAVRAAYGWAEAEVGDAGAAGVTRDQILERLLALNRERGNPSGNSPP